MNIRDKNAGKPLVDGSLLWTQMGELTALLQTP